jgi:hypothetical protein
LAETPEDPDLLPCCPSYHVSGIGKEGKKGREGRNKRLKRRRDSSKDTWMLKNG